MLTWLLASSLYNAKVACKMLRSCSLLPGLNSFEPLFQKKKEQEVGEIPPSLPIPLDVPFGISLVWYLCGLFDHCWLLSLLVQACRRPLSLSVLSVLHIDSLLITCHAWRPCPCSSPRNAWALAYLGRDHHSTEGSAHLTLQPPPWMDRSWRTCVDCSRYVLSTAGSQRTLRIMDGPGWGNFAGAQCPKQCHAGAHLFRASAAPWLPVGSKLSSSNTVGPPKRYPTGKVSENGLLCREFGSWSLWPPRKLWRGIGLLADHRATQTPLAVLTWAGPCLVANSGSFSHIFTLTDG